MKRPPAELSLNHTSNLDALCTEHPKPKKFNPKQSPGRLLRQGAPWKVYVAAEGLGSFWPAQGVSPGSSQPGPCEWLACCAVMPPALPTLLRSVSLPVQTLCCGVGASHFHPMILSDPEVMFFSVVAVSEARRS